MIKTIISISLISVCYSLIIAKANDGWTYEIGPIGVLLISTACAILSGLSHLILTKNELGEPISRMDWWSCGMNMGVYGAGMAMLCCCVIMVYTGAPLTEPVSYGIIGSITILATGGIPMIKVARGWLIKLVNLRIKPGEETRKKKK